LRSFSDILAIDSFVSEPSIQIKTNRPLPIDENSLLSICTLASRTL
jgi:hypothetical protein